MEAGADILFLDSPADNDEIRRAVAAAAGRPYTYLASAGMKMERHARELAESDGIAERLVCVFAKLEPCKSFSFKC